MAIVDAVVVAFVVFSTYETVPTSMLYLPHVLRNSCCRVVRVSGLCSVMRPMDTYIVAVFFTYETVPTSIH